VGSSEGPVWYAVRLLCRHAGWANQQVCLITEGHQCRPRALCRLLHLAVIQAGRCIAQTITVAHYCGLRPYVEKPNHACWLLVMLSSEISSFLGSAVAMRKDGSTWLGAPTNVHEGLELSSQVFFFYLITNQDCVALLSIDT
jgi:hypothetical protein